MPVTSKNITLDNLTPIPANSIFFTLHPNTMRFCGSRLHLFLLAGIVLFTTLFTATAQVCPPNIDFETGSFAGWTCYTGFASTSGGLNEIILNNSGGPVQNRHTLYARNSGAGNDEYGGFPKNCPNGSGFSIKLGNNTAGTEAEGISYEFTIPANQNIYSLIYHYAVVFQDPDHEMFQQPRLEIEIQNLTDNTIIHCSSFSFVPYGSLLPGFYESPNPSGDTPVWCKDWSAVSIDLNGLAGKRIRLFFKTADCTFRRHFGYAYVDVNSECTSEFVGSVYCKDDTAVNLTAPYGYQEYTWYNSSFTQVLGNSQTIRFSPLPPAGTTYAVAVVPYHGYGCLDTFYARLADSLTIVANAGPDILSCNETPMPIGVIPKPGMVYNWTPVARLSDPTSSNPLAAPTITTNYKLIVTHDGGGCRSEDSVLVRASIIDNAIQLIGSAAYCSDSKDSSILRVRPTDSIQWFKDGRMIFGANGTDCRITQSGSYHARLINKDGCVLTTAGQPIIIDDPRPGITYPIQYAMIGVPFDLKARQFGNKAVWSPGTSLNTTLSYTPVFKGSSEQLYTIAITTNGGCLTVDTQLVKTIKKVDVFVPTAFSPNNDRVNETLRPLLRGVKELRYFRIYNRWGNLIYETKNPQPGWDGKLNGIPQGTQTVVWVLEAMGLDGVIHFRRGTTVLVR
ncbi:MAG: gliding motility-associated C-terminal domain-containing protein [Chitinophagaceae bacterium]